MFMVDKDYHNSISSRTICHFFPETSRYIQLQQPIAWQRVSR